jgi:hypothetical protein
VWALDVGSWISWKDVELQDAAATVTVKDLLARAVLYEKQPRNEGVHDPSNGEGTNSRVAVKFENAATGQRVEARVEFGKTVIR